jgi:TPR repeat protein
MSLERVVPNASLERVHYHQLATRELNKLNDAEARYERGRRLRDEIGVDMNEEAGWKLIIKAAKRGHPVALAECFSIGRGTAKNLKRAAGLYRSSADRGHPAGLLYLLSEALTRTKLKFSWLCVTTKVQALRRTSKRLFAGAVLLLYRGILLRSSTWATATQKESALKKTRWLLHASMKWHMRMDMEEANAT